MARPTIATIRAALIAALKAATELAAVSNDQIKSFGAEPDITDFERLALNFPAILVVYQGSESESAAPAHAAANIKCWTLYVGARNENGGADEDCTALLDAIFDVLQDNDLDVADMHPLEHVDDELEALTDVYAVYSIKFAAAVVLE